MFSDHIKSAVIALINIDTSATEAERQSVLLALTGVLPNGRMVRLKDAAEIIGVHKNTVMNWVAQGKLTAVRGPTGKVIGVTEASIAAI